MSRDLGRLDIRLLMAFEALAAERNVTRAAARLGITQQGLSNQLSKLRDLFDDPLFVRAKSGVSPTPRAESLEPSVRSALAGLEKLISPIQFDPSVFKGTVTIAATDYAIAMILPRLLGALSAHAPGLRLSIWHADTGSLAEEMRDASIDLALTVPQFAPAGLRFHKLFEERYVGVARVGHPIHRGSSVSVDAFCGHPHLLVSPFKGDASGPTDEALATIGRTRKVGLVVPGFSVVGALLEQSDLISVLPDRLIKSMRRDLKTFETPVPVQGFDLCVYWPERLHASSLNKWLREQIISVAQDDLLVTME